jgi:exopolysaccharide production protein ExoF
MGAHDNAERVTNPLHPALSRMGMKYVLLALGISAFAIALATEALKNWEPIEVVSEAVVQKVFAAIGPGQGELSPDARATSESPSDGSGAHAAAASLVEPSVASVVPTVAKRSKIVSTDQAVPAGVLFGVGDRLKVAFYERVEVEEDKWGRSSSASALRGVLQRLELSGEYAVQDDGTISVPLLGSIPVANRSAQQVHADLVEAFDQLLGRNGLVNILSLERSPIYVLGPVKNPGSFKYVPGMTILHAIALSGGLDRGTSEPWQKIGAVRQAERRDGPRGRGSEDWSEVMPASELVNGFISMDNPVGTQPGRRGPPVAQRSPVGGRVKSFKPPLPPQLGPRERACPFPQKDWEHWHGAVK